VRPGWPFKTNSPLVVDTDAVLAFAAAFKPFKPVAGSVQGAQPVSGMQPFKTQHRRPIKSLKRPDPPSLEELTRPLVAKAYYHAAF
jgi:hypothetical protein